MQPHADAAKAGPAVPENGDALTADTVQSVFEQESSNSLNSDGVLHATQDVDSKLFATLQARAALAGFELVRMADDSFVVARWTMTRALADVLAVERFLKQVAA
jgi:hypothetical protein